MQRVRVLSDWNRASAWRLPAVENVLVGVLLGSLLVGASALILAYPKHAIWDQERLLETRFEAPYYPSPAVGFTAQLLVVAVKSLAPAGAPVHEIVRIAAMLLWVAGAVWLASAVLCRRASLALLLLLLFTSQYPFLWYSSELVAGGVLSLAIAARARGVSPWVVGPLLVLVGLCKLEMWLVAGVLLVYWARTSESPEERKRLLVGFAAALVLLVSPGLLLVGPTYAYEIPGGPGKGFATFRQHFAALVAPFQIGPAPPPWQNSGPYFDRVFPGADSMLDVLTAPGARYLDFAALSASRGVRKAAWTFGWSWLAVPVLFWGWRRRGSTLAAREKSLLLSFVGCVPFVFLSYPHIRYFARFYAIFWLLLLMGLERASRSPDRWVRGPCTWATWVIVLVAFAQNVQRSAIGLAAAPYLEQYWFSD